MSLTLEYLSEILLEDVFRYLDPINLFDICFLNKYLFEVVGKVIKSHLIHSVYNHNKYGKYYDYQKKFIMENGALIKYININDDTIELLNFCSDIMSITYTQSLNKHYNKLAIKFPKLRKLCLAYYKHSQPMVLFDNHLKQLEVFEINGSFALIEDNIRGLDPYKVKVLKMYSDREFCLDGLDIIKKFKELRVLHLKSKKTILIPTVFNSNINFNPNLKLKIEGRLSNLCIKCLGDLKQSRKMEIFNYDTSYFDVDNKNNNLTLIQNSNIISLGKFNSSDIIDYDFLKLPTLKKIYFNKFSKNILYLISPLTNIQTIYFDELCFNIKEIFNKTNLNENDLYNKEYNSIKCNSIKEISIDKFNFSLNTFLCFLALFPCLRFLKIRDSFKLESINTEVQYNLTTPLLLIAPMTYKLDLAYYDEVEKIPMLSLIKSK